MTDLERHREIGKSHEELYKVRREICILEKKLREAGEHLQVLGRALEKDPSSVKRSVREHTFEFQDSTAVELDVEELGNALAELEDAHKKRVAAESVLEPRLGGV